MLNVLLLGKTGRGKSTTGNKLINRDGDDPSLWAKDETVKREWPEEPTGENRSDKMSSEPIRFVAEKSTISVTRGCSIISNTQMGFRVMDTRGFAPSDFTGHVYLANLQIMREVVGITAVKNLRFDRVLYFLPDRDIPERADGYLQEELSVLWHFYGEIVFRNMVIVVTAPSSKSSTRSTNPDLESKFGEGSTEDVKDVFMQAMKQAIDSRENATLPSCPNVVFIPQHATNVSVAKIVRNALALDKDRIKLEFQKTTCSRCASVIHITGRKGNASVAAAEVEGKIKVPEESTCHPVIIPKYTRLKKVGGGVAHIVTLGIPQGIYTAYQRFKTGTTGKTLWPWFKNSEEKCAKCQHAPSVKGCTKIGEKYGSEIVVEHSHKMLEVQVEDAATDA